MSLVIKAYMIQRIEFSPECQSLCGGWEVSCTLPVTLGATPAVSDLWGTDPLENITVVLHQPAPGCQVQLGLAIVFPFQDSMAQSIN